LSDLSDLLSNSDLFVGDTVEVLDTVGSAIGEDASMTIRATHRAVVAAQGGARAIDSTLSALSVVEFLTGVSYDPEQSLSASLEDVAASLDDLPETLTGVQESMEDSAESLDQLRPRIMRVSGDLESLSENVFSAVDLVESQRVTVRRVAGNVQSLDRELAKWFWVPVATLFIGALGLGILFLGLYVLGSELRTSAEK
jgi:methyl-accepting chemotaxis protein